MTVHQVSSAARWRFAARREAWWQAGRRAWTRLPGPVARLVRFLSVGDPQPRPRRALLALDACLAAVLTVMALAVAHKATATDCVMAVASPICSQPAPSLVHHGVGLVAMMTTVPIAFRRIRPLTVFWLVVAAVVLVPRQSDNVVSLAAVVLASYSAVVHGRYRRAAMASVLAAGFLVSVAFPTVAAPLTLPGRATVAIALVPVLFLANAVTELRRRAGDSQARLARLEAEHAAATEQALARERARIASELHDVVTHNVSVMIVQAGAARQVLAGSPADARQSLLAVESSGRAAMAELRHLLGLLSPATGPAGIGDQQACDQLAGDQTLWLQPQPGLSRLPALVERVRAAGLDVRLAVGAMPPELPSGVDLAAYRVIQEALTNVLKHAGASPTTVSVAVRDGDLIAEVADAGPQGGAQPAAARTVPGSGRGLLGLRERVALYGGELFAGPQSGGGWLVRARLPASAAL